MYNNVLYFILLPAYIKYIIAVYIPIGICTAVRCIINSIAANCTIDKTQILDFVIELTYKLVTIRMRSVGHDGTVKHVCGARTIYNNNNNIIY